MNVRRAFRLFGQFQWPPVPGKADPKKRSQGIIEIGYLQGGHGSWSAFLCWTPATVARLSSPLDPPPAGAANVYSVADLEAALGDGSKPVKLWIDQPPGAEQPQETKLEFLGARVLDGFAADPENRLEIRLPLSFDFELRQYSTGKAEPTESGITIGFPGDEFPPFGFGLIVAIPTPGRQTMYRDTEALAFRTDFWSTVEDEGRIGAIERLQALPDTADGASVDAIHPKDYPKAPHRLATLSVAPSAASKDAFLPLGTDRAWGLFWPTNSHRAAKRLVSALGIEASPEGNLDMLGAAPANPSHFHLRLGHVRPPAGSSFAYQYRVTLAPFDQYTSPKHFDLAVPLRQDVSLKVDPAGSDVCIDLTCGWTISDSDILQALKEGWSGRAIGRLHVVAELAWDEEVSISASQDDGHRAGTLISQARSAMTSVRQSLLDIERGQPQSLLPEFGEPAARRRRLRVFTPSFEGALAYGGDGGRGADRPARLFHWRYGRRPFPYGRRFRYAAYSLTRSGSLPKEVRDRAPWLPGKIASFESVKNRTGAVEDSRRTAIGATVITGKRIGLVPPGVFPLSDDYPRTVAYSVGKDWGFVDILRNSDGTGGLKLDDNNAVETVWLSDLISWNGAAEISLRIIDAPDAHPTLTGNETDPVPDDGVWIKIPGRRVAVIRKIVVMATEEQPQADEIRLKAPRGKQFWLRLAVRSPDGQKQAFISFVTIPGDGRDEAYSATRSAPLVLVGKNISNRTKWSPGFDEVEATIDLPRVTLEDFDRWLSNDDLLTGSFADQRDGQDLRKLLRVAHVLFGDDPTISARMNRLPDPAVSGYQFDVVPSDAFDPDAVKPWQSQSAAWLPLHKVKVGGYAALKALVEKMNEGDLPSAELGRAKGELRNLLEKLDAASRLTLRVSAAHDKPKLKISDPAGEFATVSVAVPSGTCAQLVVRPRVARTLLSASHGHPPAIDPRQLELATGNDGDGALLFPGAELRIEAMSDGFGEFAKPDETTSENRTALSDVVEWHLAVTPAGRARRYAMSATNAAQVAQEEYKPIHGFLWRHVSHVGIATQRFRPSGRGQYEWIDPADHVREGCRTDRREPAIELSHGTEPVRDEALDRFEAQAFFARMDVDADVRTARVAPLPGRSGLPATAAELQAFPWDQPTATYFRHRFVLKSRYRGAMLQGVAEIREWRHRPESSKLGPWTRRVAMLAEPGRIELTRPQLRSLETTTASFAAADEAPPILCRLEEAPCSQGGLAERLLAEIAVGPGYGFDDAGAVPVMPQDFGKEIGPDPRLSLEPFPSQERFTEALACTLFADGPLGLHYDRASTASPAYANSAFVLRPGMPAGSTFRVPEECFVAVRLTRVLDPAWTVSDSAPPSPDRLSALASWWIEMSDGGALCFGNKNAEVCSIETENGDLVVKVDRRFVDPSAQTKKLVVARAAREQASIVLLHAPREGGRYGLTVLLRPEGGSDVANGVSNAPRPLATIEWSPGPQAVTVRRGAGPSEAAPDVPTSEGQGETPGEGAQAAGVDGAASPILLLRGAQRIEPLRSGEATDSQWVRTSRNFNVFPFADGDPKSNDMHRVSLRDLRARLVKEGEKDRYRLRFRRLAPLREVDGAPAPTLRDRGYPLHVHRHLCYVFTRADDEPGRLTERFERIYPPDLPILDKPGAISGLRILEYETPAVIGGAVASGGDGGIEIPSRYKRPYIDLTATGGVGGHVQRYDIFIRNAAPERKAPLGPLYVIMRCEDISAASGEGTLSNSNPDGLKLQLWPPAKGDGVATPLAFHIVLTRSTGEALAGDTFVAEVVYPGLNGRVAPGDGMAKLKVPQTLSGFSLEFQEKQESEENTKDRQHIEFWADISLLWSNKNRKPGEKGASVANGWPAMDPDWLFSPAPQDGELHNQFEAQARLIAISPMIPLERE